MTYEADDQAPNYRVPRSVGLEEVRVRQGLTVETLNLEALVESHVGDTNTEPSHEAGNGGHYIKSVSTTISETSVNALTIDKPVEYTARARGDTHVRKRGEERAEDERDNRKAAFRDLGEDLGRVARESETVLSRRRKYYHRICASDHLQRARELVYRSLDAADHAEVRSAALMTEGRPLIPAVLIAITKGDPAALEVVSWRSGLSEGTSREMMVTEVM